MGSEWEETTIGDRFDLANGFAFKSRDFEESGIPVIKIKNVKAGHFSDHTFSFVSPDFLESRKEKLAKVDDLLISMSGNRHDGSPETWVGKIARFNRPGHYFINQRVGALRVKDPSIVDPKFASYLLSSWHYQQLFISIATSSGGQANLSPAQILGASFEYPPLPEQKAIAHILGTLDDRIELNRRMNATLEGMAQALFKSWFVDFDPVIDNALAAGNPIPDELAPRAEVRRQALASGTTQQGSVGMPNLPDFKSLFPATFEITEGLGWVPAGWETSTIGEECETVGGGTPSTKNPAYWDGGKFPWVTPKDFSSLQDKVLLSSNRFLTKGGLSKVSSGLLPIGTVLMSSRAPVGYLAITQIETAINQGFIAMVCNGRLSPEYVLQWASSRMDDIKQTSSGSTFAEISKKAFRPFQVIVPANKVLERYTESVGSIYQQIARNLGQNATLSSLRDTLLPKLISGELRANA